ncbi:uncharacterized protein LOC111298726 [Durio zibethinus]|uniref:Uncharacterized protein LOC111298726 n=1 Tax=Durio zibethinus TaxID=66656 RepID=A0A6P5Z8V2_DURZI|nr:uncharacterized protein LOC111298726 [Durio zibethinus]
MDVEGSTREGSVSSVILESLESTRKGDKLSAEDLPWVDSCLIADTEILKSNWTSFKDVLLEIIGDQLELLDSPATGSDGFAGGTVITANYLGGTDHDLVVIPINGNTVRNTNGIPIKWTGIRSPFFQDDSTETFRRYPFLPTYNKEKSTDGAIDLGLGLSLSAADTNSSTVDIFGVWDLDIPAEEDDFIKQLYEAIAEIETSFQSMPLAFDDLMAWKDLNDESVDELIAGIADLCLDTINF